MSKNRITYIRAAASALVAGVALLVLMTTLAGARIKAAPSHSPTDNAPSIEAITVTSNLAISDTHPGAGTDKTVYFSNTVPGVITLTFEVSGTPTVTFTTGAAFDGPQSTYTSTITPATFAVTYSVAATHTTQPHVAYTATDTNGGPTTVAITYGRDITAPTTTIAYPMVGQYVTATHLDITGTAEDNDDGSGVRRVQVTTDTTWTTGDGVDPWTYTWTLPITDGAVYTISARAEDYLGILQHPAAMRIITVDNVAPPNPDLVTTTDGTVTSTWISYNTIPVSWTEVADGSGVDYYYGWDQSSSTNLEDADSFTATTVVTGASLPEDDNYFHLRTRDGAGNWTTDTLHLGPFKVDTLSPTVSISTPTSGAALTKTQQPTVSVSGATSDGVSGVSAVSVTLNGGGAYTDAFILGTNWGYEWTLPEEDNVAHTLWARARDEAGNIGLSSIRVITVDTVAPTTTRPTPDNGPWITSVVVYTWTESNNGTNIAGHRVSITNTEGYSYVRPTPNTVFTFTQAYSEGVSYYARVLAWDNNGNVGVWSGPSWVVTPDLTVPTITNPFIAASWGGLEGAEKYLLNDLHLYYRNDGSKDAPFTIHGYLSDTLSGGEKSVASRAFGSGPYTSTEVYPAGYHFSYQIGSGITDSGLITVTCYDAARNTVSQAYTYTYDGTPPYTGSVEINDGAQFATAKQVTLTIHSDDFGCGVDEMCITDTQAACTEWKTYETERIWDLSGDDGIKTIHVRFRDHLQNTSLAYTGTIALDTTPPTSTATSPDFEDSDTISVTYDAKDEVAGIVTVTLWYKFDAGDWMTTGATLTGTAGSFVFTPTDEGKYYFQTIAKDKASHVEDGGEPSGDGDASTIYDITTPTSEITSPTYVNTGTIPVTYTASDEVGDIDVSGISTVALWYKFDGGVWAVTEHTSVISSGTFAFNPTQGNGRYCFRAVATDNAGNCEDEPSGMGNECTIYDTLSPTSEAAAPAYTNTAPIPVTYTASDYGSGIAEVALWYKFEDGDWMTTEQTLTDTFGAFVFTPTNEGKYCFQTIATDNAGNEEDGPSREDDYCTIYDTTDPTSTATSPEYDNLGSITVEYTATDDRLGIAKVTLWYTFGGGAWTDSGLTSTGDSGSFVFSPTLDDGTYCFQTIATDEASNKEALKYSGAFSCTIYDTTDPTSTATSPEYDGGGTIPVAYVANGEVAGIKDVALWYKFDDNGWEDTGRRSIHVTDTFHFDPSDGDGKYCFQTIATDKASNKEALKYSGTFSCTIYDTIEPSSTATSPEYENGDTISVTYVASDPHTVNNDVSGIATVMLWYKNDNDDWMTTGENLTGTTGTFVFTPTGEGKFYFQTIATDNAGNVEDGGELSDTGDDFTVYDVTTPTSEIMSPAYVNMGTIPVTYTASDEVEGIEESGIATVMLWYKFEDGDWMTTEHTSTDLSNTFVFNPKHDDGKYCFQSIATDNAGNTEKLPEDDGGVCTVYDTIPPAATAITAWDATECPIYVTWVATDTHSGVHSVTLWYSKASTVTNWTPTLTTEVEHEMVYATSDAFEFCPTEGDGTYLFAVTAVDNAGNLEPRPIVSETQALFDTKVPQSEVTWAPEYWNRSPITMTWVATKSEANLTEVRLWYRFSAGEWSSTSITSAAESGVFSFTPESGDGIYYFATVAKDELGKSELPPPPVSEGDVFVIYDTASPTSTATSPEYDKEGAIPITYTASDEEPGVDDVSGVAAVTLWYKFDNRDWEDTKYTATDETGTFDFIPEDGDGIYYFQTVATDRATNAENEPSRDEDGDTHTIYDTTAPTSTAGSPEYDNEGLIPITYTANGDVAGLDKVTLWYKLGDGDWVTTEHTSTAIYDTFAFSPTYGDSVYHFQTIATDMATNVEDGPYEGENGDTFTIYDITDPIVVITAPEHTSDKTFVVEWGADASVSGLDHYDVMIRVKDGPWQDWLTGTTETSKIFTTSIGDITYGFSVTTYDNAGNSAYTETETYVGPFRIYLPLVVRNYPPQPVGSVIIDEEEQCVHRPAVTLHLSATVERDTVEWMCISNSPECDDNWIEFAEQHDWTLAGGVSGLRTVYVWFKGGAGGISESAASDTVYLAWNGGFEDGWYPWEHEEGELNQSRSQDQVHEGEWSALLGDPEYKDDKVPIGSARIWQTFSVPSSGNPEITIWYHIYTRDKVWGDHTKKYYDSFEIYINDVNWSEANNPDPSDPWRKTRCRENLGISDASNPGLVFCDGGTGPGEGKLSEWERHIMLDLSQFKGQDIVLYLANFNREDHHFNTWTYVDDICVNW